MTVVEKFDNWLRYTPLSMATLESRVTRFIKGLDYHIGDHFVAHDKNLMGYIFYWSGRKRNEF